MKSFNLIILYACAILITIVMYSPQPLQPYFEQLLGISKVQASLFTTSILIPLSFSSILYGYLLEKLPIKKVLVIAFFILAISEVVFASVSNYYALISMRIVQGFMAPAVMTGILSYISYSAHKQVARAVGIYIGMTIVGGFVGRMLSGICTDLFGWRTFFYLQAIVLFIMSYVLYKMLSDIEINFIKPKLKHMIKIWSIRRNRYIFTAIFCLFFVFQATLNILPFELKNISGVFSGSKTGFMYAGYIVGVFLSFNISRIVAFTKTPLNAVSIGFIIYIISLQFLRMENFYTIFLSMVVFYFGGFLIHTVATSHINKSATSHKAITNGLYISSYYFGGALGSFLPSFIYNRFGWNVLLTALSVVLCLALLLTLRLRQLENTKFRMS